LVGKANKKFTKVSSKAPHEDNERVAKMDKNSMAGVGYKFKSPFINFQYDICPNLRSASKLTKHGVKFSPKIKFLLDLELIYIFMIYNIVS
jgi:hypothetical protein